jgi:hypothetical protein
VKHNRLEIAKHLVEKEGADPSRCTTWPDAARKGYIDMLSYGHEIWRSGEEDIVLYDEETWWSDDRLLSADMDGKVLYCAIRGKQLEVVEFLLAHFWKHWCDNQVVRRGMMKLAGYAGSIRILELFERLGWFGESAGEDLFDDVTFEDGLFWARSTYRESAIRSIIWLHKKGFGHDMLGRLSNHITHSHCFHLLEWAHTVEAFPFLADHVGQLLSGGSITRGVLLAKKTGMVFSTDQLQLVKDIILKEGLDRNLEARLVFGVSDDV